MNTQVCPEETAGRIALGCLPGEELEVVAVHVEGCSSCEVRLEALEGQSDSVFAALRKTVRG